MNRPILAPLIVALALGGCGKQELALADDPVTRAAQCGVVATAEARVGQTDVKAPLPFAVQARVLHYAALAGAAGEGYDDATTKAVLKRLPEVEPQVTGGKWQALAPACAEAFPAATAPATLPAGTLGAQLGCSLLGDYVGGALQSQEANYQAELAPVMKMRAGLDNRIGARLHRAGQTDTAEQKGARDKAMAAIVQSGAAADVLKACVERYG